MFIGMSNLQEVVTTYRFGAIPSELTGHLPLGVLQIVFEGRPVRVDFTSPVPTWATIFTSMFLHGGWLHLGGNMLFLWVFGDNIEDRFGHVGYLLFYLVAGAIAVASQVAISPGSEAPIIGASGAIAGVLGAYAVLYSRSRINTLFFFGIAFVARVPALYLLGGWLLFQVFVGAATGTAGSGVAYFAHIGGFTAGALGAWLLQKARVI